MQSKFNHAYIINICRSEIGRSDKDVRCGDVGVQCPTARAAAKYGKDCCRISRLIAKLICIPRHPHQLDR